MKFLKEYNINLLSDSDDNDLEYASSLIKSGELVGIPTETVYGLGANALDAGASKKIFEAKGRPSDNPLIVHISNIGMLPKLAHNIPDLAYTLAKEFWPGPLTLILPKNDIVPFETSGGLDTVGIRMPKSVFTRKLIDKSKCPIAAPSANISGYPSPTTALHVCKDLAGKIKAVVDGGECSVGVESTVISFDDADTVRILRPGYITPEMLSKFCNVVIDKAITEGLKNGETAKSPGMKYKHYAPKANVIMIDAGTKEFCDYIKTIPYEDGVYILTFNGEESFSNAKCIPYGKDSSEMARNLFAYLRKLDDVKAKKVYVHAPKKEGVGLAVYNRLIRAAGFEVVCL